MALKRLATENTTLSLERLKKKKNQTKCGRSPGLPGFRSDADQGVERIL